MEKSNTTSWGGEWLAKPLRNLLLAQLSKITYGSLVFSEGSELTTCGESREGEPRAMIRVVRSSIWERTVFGGSVGAAESYMDGDWTTDDLVAVVRIFSGTRDVMYAMEGGRALLKWPALKLWHFMRRDTIEQSRRNIAAHYDLGNEFFDANFLDLAVVSPCISNT